MTRLSISRELDGKFIIAVAPGHRREVEAISEAQGVQFLCPKCFAVNGGPVGTHSIICWSRSAGTPEDEVPGPGRWKLDGDGLDTLTLNGDQVGGGGARSVQLHGGCAWHGFVTDGFAHDDIPPMRGTVGDSDGDDGA